MIHEHKLRKSVAFSLNMVTFRAYFLHSNGIIVDDYGFKLSKQA